MHPAPVGVARDVGGARLRVRRVRTVGSEIDVNPRTPHRSPLLPGTTPYWKYFLLMSRRAATAGGGSPSVSGEKPPPLAPKNRKLKSNPLCVCAIPWQPWHPPPDVIATGV